MTEEYLSQLLDELEDKHRETATLDDNSDVDSISKMRDGTLNKYSR